MDDLNRGSHRFSGKRRTFPLPCEWTGPRLCPPRASTRCSAQVRMLQPSGPTRHDLTTPWHGTVHGRVCRRLADRSRAPPLGSCCGAVRTWVRTWLAERASALPSGPRPGTVLARPGIAGRSEPCLTAWMTFRPDSHAGRRSRRASRLASEWTRPGAVHLRGYGWSALRADCTTDFDTVHLRVWLSQPSGAPTINFPASARSHAVQPNQRSGVCPTVRSPSSHTVFVRVWMRWPSGQRPSE